MFWRGGYEIGPLISRHPILSFLHWLPISLPSTTPGMEGEGGHVRQLQVVLEKGCEIGPLIIAATGSRQFFYAAVNQGLWLIYFAAADTTRAAINSFTSRGRDTGGCGRREGNGIFKGISFTSWEGNRCILRLSCVPQLERLKVGKRKGNIFKGKESEERKNATVDFQNSNPPDDTLEEILVAPNYDKKKIS